MDDMDLGAAVVWLSRAFAENKTLFEHSLGFHNDALHVFVGVGLQVVAAVILKKSLAHWLPWMIVLVLELANEGNDLFSEIWSEPAMQMGEGLKDLLLTIAIPTLLLALTRWMPQLFQRTPADRQESMQSA